VIRQGFEPGPDDPHWQLVDGARFVHVSDQSVLSEPLAKQAIELADIHTFLAVPLRKDKALLGRIVAARQGVRPFSDKAITLIADFAAQAVIAMENARLLTETREALEQQTATTEVLQVINGSPGNLVPVFDRVIQKAMQLCGAAFGGLYIYGRERLVPVATRGVPSAFVDYRAQNPPTGRPGTRGARVLETKKSLHILDARVDESYLYGDAGDRAVVDLGGARTLLLVPLLKEVTLLGIIAIYRQEVRAFSDKQIALLENFAAQAVIAMENARLLTETREALEQQTATAEVLQVINASPGNLAPVFDAMLEKALRLCEAAFGIINTYDDELFHPVAMRSPPALADTFRSAPNLPRASRHSGLRRIVLGEDVVQIEDLAADPVYQEGEARRVIEAAGAHSYLGVALRLEGKLLGTIGTYRQEVRPFSDKQIALLQNFAAQAVIAMENARLLGELHQRTDEVAELNRGLEARVAEQVEELGRVGRLKRFLAPQLAELIVSQGNEQILESHRREIVVVFCDLRGYTAFAETAEPEEVLDFLRNYHGALGPLVAQFEGTLDQFSGDGIMVFFNDPVPIPDPAARAVNMAVAMREAAGTLIADWRERGRELGFGAGIAQGYATLGQIGFSERSGYTAIGTVCNVAARLCAEAKSGQILLSQRVNVALRGSVITEQVGALALKGLTQPVVAYNVPLAATQPALRVIEGDPQSH
jgi:adenylate cyclase